MHADMPVLGLLFAALISPVSAQEQKSYEDSAVKFSVRTAVLSESGQNMIKHPDIDQWITAPRCLSSLLILCILH